MVWFSLLIIVDQRKLSMTRISFCSHISIENVFKSFHFQLNLFQLKMASKAIAREIVSTIIVFLLKRNN